MGLRILLVTRRFWPVCSPAEMSLLEMVDGWRLAGASVSVVTPQWDRSWPLHVVVREMAVTRLPYSPKRLWSEYRYMRLLARWLHRQAGQFDLVVVWRMRLDALTAVRQCAQQKKPVVLLYEGAAELGDGAWLKGSRHRERILEACRSATAILATSPASLEELRELEIEEGQCHLIKGIYPTFATAQQLKASARIQLIESNRDFFTTAATPVGLTAAALEDREALQELFAAWMHLREDHHDARLWWIGDGPKRSALYSLLGDYDLRYHVVLPGDFDDMEELTRAADVYVAPTPLAARAIRQCLAAGLPVIAADMRSIRANVPADAPVRYYRPRDVVGLAEKLRQVFDAPAARVAWSAECLQWAHAQGSAADAAKAHLALFSSLLPGRS